MIAFLSGIPRVVDGHLMVMVNGVGYGVSVNPTLLHRAITTPTIELFIYTHVKEEALELYGFATYEEKKLFSLLLSVSGIGPRIALGIVGQGSEALTTAVQEAQVGFFTAIPRVGKKLAQKIIIELRGKLGEIKTLSLGAKSSVYQDVLESLMSLGFAETAIIPALDAVDLELIGEESALKQILKQLGKRK